MIRIRLLQYLSNEKKHVVWTVVWQWLGLLCRIGIALCFSFLLSGRTRGNQTALFAALGAILLGALGQFVCDEKRGKAAGKAGMGARRRLREALYDKLLRLGPSYRQKVSSGEVMQLTTEGVEQLETYFGKYLPQLFYALLAPLTLFAILIHVDLHLSLVLLVCVPLIPVTIVLVMKVAKRLLGRYWDTYARLGDSFLDCLQGMTTLKTYGADGQAAERMDRESETFRRVTMKVLTMQLSSTAVMDLIAYGASAWGMILAALSYSRGEIRIAQALLVVLLAPEFFLPMRLLGSYFHIAMNGMAASDRIFAILDLPEQSGGEERNLGDRVDIRIEGVSFAYPDAGEEGESAGVLRNVSAEIMSGSLVSIVGESGCGKSTLARLLAGRLRGYDGSIRLNGVELSALSERCIRNHVTLVSDESYLFRGTVRENLRMGDPEVADDRLRAALRRVGLLLSMDMKEGLDTRIEEGGSNLSGGQRQRLCLARALLHDTPVYVFDEATSHVDPDSEELILQVLRELSADHTVLLITHRLGSVVSSRRICLLSGGALREEGTHAQLLEKGGLYATMFRTQKESEGFSSSRQAREARSEVAGQPRIVRVRAGGVEGTDENGQGFYHLRENAQAPSDKDSRHSRGKRALVPRLLHLVRPLSHVMSLAVILGVLGFGCAIFLPILVGGQMADRSTPVAWLTLAAVLALLRGVFHYGEQYCNHYIAFRLLALIRHRVFAALRNLCPAKLETREKGNLISLIMGDIELLEVFFAHTISPVAIAALVSLLMSGWIAAFHPLAGAYALLSYGVVGIWIPLWSRKRTASPGREYREGFGQMNSFLLSSLYGVDETIQYDCGEARKASLKSHALGLEKLGRKLVRAESTRQAVTELVIRLLGLGEFLLCAALFANGQMTYAGALVAVLSLMSSFGPVAALSALSGSLSQTMAAGERILALLEERPLAEEIPEQTQAQRAAAASVMDAAGAGVGLRVQEISFGYDSRALFRDFSASFPAGHLTGICGKSGCGKSTLLRLLMRFWVTDSGRIELAGTSIDEIPTARLRALESFLPQETWLFQDTVRENIRLGNPDAVDEEIVEAAKKARIHERILSLPKGYDTVMGELGENLSAGEKQRVGLARAFLHDGAVLLLDEPTSNLDALSEGMILKALDAHAAGRTVILVSHRRSALHQAELIYEMEG